MPINLKNITGTGATNFKVVSGVGGINVKIIPNLSYSAGLFKTTYSVLANVFEYTCHAVAPDRPFTIINSGTACRLCVCVVFAPVPV